MAAVLNMIKARVQINVACDSEASRMARNLAH